MKKERDQERQALSNIRDHQQREQQAYEDERRAFGRWDDALDCVDAGPRWLAQMQVASIVEQALHYWHSKVYELAAFCIMPNHVHLVCTPLTQEDGKYYSLAQILHSL
ncbi:MAG: hypothetical protein JXA78_00625 [Anaerolineales bacterium]|nr:hypothetical protein [Anaerolineales bacterium]